MATFLGGNHGVVRVVCYTPSQISINTAYVECVSAVGTSVTDRQLAEYLAPIMAGVYKPVLSAAARFRGVGVRVWNDPPFTNAEVTAIGSDGVGTGGAGLLPTQCSPVLSLKTAVAGPRGRGRLYIPFPSPGAFDADGTPSAGYLILGNNLGAEFVGDFVVNMVDPANNATFRWVLSGPPIDPARIPPPDPPRPLQTWTRILDAQMADKCGTQRRRGTYGRTNVLPF